MPVSDLGLTCIFQRAADTYLARSDWDLTDKFACIEAVILGQNIFKQDGIAKIIRKSTMVEEQVEVKAKIKLELYLGALKTFLSVEHIFDLKMGNLQHLFVPVLMVKRKEYLRDQQKQIACRSKVKKTLFKVHEEYHEKVEVVARELDFTTDILLSTK